MLDRNVSKKKIRQKKSDWLKWRIEEGSHAVNRKRPQMADRDVYASRYVEWKKVDQKGAKKVTKKPNRTPFRQNKGIRIRWIGKLQKPEP